MSTVERIESLAQLSDQELVEGLVALIGEERRTMAEVLAHLGEVDARKLYLPAACSSLHVYCVERLGFSEHAAFKRITAARAARKFPVLLEALADGRLHLCGVVELAPHLQAATVEELVAAAAHRSSAEIRQLLAARAPKPDRPERLTKVPEPPPELLATSRVEPPPERPTTRTEPLSATRHALQVTIDQATRDKLSRAQALLRHRVPSGDLAQVIDRALDALLADLERTKLAKVRRPRACKPAAPEPKSRQIPRKVVRAVLDRDGERCSFVSEDGRRCNERGFLEIDHVVPVARGGVAEGPDDVRVLCRSHNQYEAERVLGVDFMRERRSTRGGEDDDVLAALRGLGFTVREAQGALDRSTCPDGTPIEERLRAALRSLHTA